MFFALYILYAFVQAILLARYAFDEHETPVLMVCLLAAFAPVTSVITVGFAIHYAITWLVTYKKK